MTWNPADSVTQPRKRGYRRGMPHEAEGGTPSPTSSIPGALPVSEEAMLPTFAQALAWEEGLDDEEAPQRWTLDYAREMQDMGIVSDQAWAQWARMCRRGNQAI